jgi:hypothetical protein
LPDYLKEHISNLDQPWMCGDGTCSFRYEGVTIMLDYDLFIKTKREIKLRDLVE